MGQRNGFDFGVERHREALDADGELVTLPAAASTAVLTEAGHPDAPLFAMDPKLQALYGVWATALQEHSVAEGKFFAEKPKQPNHPAYNGDTVGWARALADYELARRASKADILSLKNKHKVDALSEDFVVILRAVAAMQVTMPASLDVAATVCSPLAGNI